MNVIPRLEETQSYQQTMNREPYDFYETVRKRGNVVWDPGMNAWLVVSYKLVRDILLNDKLFESPLLTMQASEVFKRLRINNPRSFQFLTGEEHHAMHRWWVIDLLSSKWVDKYRSAFVEPVVDHVLHQLADRTSLDIVADFAERIPVAVLVGLLGLPMDDQSITRLKVLNENIMNFLQLAHSLKLDSNPDASDEDKRVIGAAVASAEELNDILLPYIRERNGSSADDFISRLWQGGPKLYPDWGEVDMLDSCRRLLFAGSDTTTHAIANAYFMLLSDRDLMKSIAGGDKATVDRFVEEVLRLNGSVHLKHRRVMADTELDGIPIKKGDMVVALLMAANRDEAAFPCPHAVNMGQKSSKNHLAFTVGPRVCPGASLARAEMSIAISKGLRRMSNIRFAPDAQRPNFEGFLLRSYKPLMALKDLEPR